MIENSNQPNRELAVVGQKPSYLVGVAAGAAAGAVALDLYVRINPLFLGSAAQVATAYISGDIPTVQTLLMTGAAVGAIAGVIRTAVDRRWGVQKDTITKVAIDTATGFSAAPMATIAKCMVFPIASELWNKLPFIAQTLTCSAIGGLTATVIAPVGIAASTAARLANQYYAK
jgi:hypothetical protein